MRWDVITIGGGLSGTAFAIALAKAGARVLLFEKSGQVHHKVCGEFLSEESLTLLNSLDIDPISMGACAQKHIRLVSGCRQAVSELPFNAAGLSRYRLDQALLDRAADCGVAIRRGSPVKAIGFEEGRISVKVDEKIYSASSVGYATGKFNIKAIHRPLSQFVGYKVMITLSSKARQELGNTVQLMAYDGGYQGIQFVEDDQASVCWLVKKSQAKLMGNDLDAHLRFLSSKSSSTGDLLSGARTSWSRPLAISVPLYGFLRCEMVHPRLFPLGDQMAVIPSFTGDGMAIALGSGLAAAESVTDGCNADSYQSSMVKNLRSQFFWARAGNWVILNSFGRMLGIHVANVLPDFVGFLANTTRFRQATRLATADVEGFHP